MKNFKNYTIVFLLGLMIPLVLGYLYQVPGLNLNPSEMVSQDKDDTSLEDAKAKLQHLYDVDVQDYQRLKTLEDKYSKANDILAKMMTIFLADLGLRISKNDIVEMVAESQNEVPSSASNNSSSPRECPKAPKAKTCPSLTEMAKDQGYKLVQSANPKDKKWVKNEAQLSSLSESESGDFLKSVEIENFFDEVRSMNNAKDSTWSEFNGRFEGLMRFDQADRAPADIMIEIDVVKLDGKTVGNYKIELSREGQAFSSSSGDGNATILKKNDYSQGVFLDLGGKQGFLQLYFVGGRNTLIGNYYRQTDVSSFKKEGTAKIYRR